MRTEPLLEPRLRTGFLLCRQGLDYTAEDQAPSESTSDPLGADITVYSTIPYIQPPLRQRSGTEHHSRWL